MEYVLSPSRATRKIGEFLVAFARFHTAYYVLRPQSHILMTHLLVPSTRVLSQPSDQAKCSLSWTGVLITCEVLLQLAEAVNLLLHVWTQLWGNVVFATAFLLPLFGAVRLCACRLILQVRKGQCMSSLHAMQLTSSLTSIDTGRVVRM